MLSNCQSATKTTLMLKKILSNFNNCLDQENLTKADTIAKGLEQNIKYLWLDSKPIPFPSFQELESFENKDNILQILPLPANKKFIAFVQTNPNWPVGKIQYYDPVTHKLWEDTTLKLKDLNTNVTCVYTDPNKNSIIIGFKNGTVHSWEMSSDYQLKFNKVFATRNQNYIAGVVQFGYSDIMAVSNNGTADFFNPFGGESKDHRKIGEYSNIKGIALRDDDHYMTVDEYGLHFQAMTSNSRVFLGKYGHAVTCANRAPDGRAIFGTDYGQILIYDFKKDELVTKFYAGKEKIKSVSCGYRKIFVVSEDNTIKTFGVKA